MGCRYAILAGAEAWSFSGVGARASTGIAVIHGFTGNPTTTRPLGEVLAERGFCVEVPRLPGHGSHWRDMLDTRYADWRREAEQTLQRLSARCERVVLVGLSLGGTIALDLGSHNPERLAGVVTINATVLDREGLLAKVAPLISRFVPVVPASAVGLVKNDAARRGVDEKAYGWVPTRAAQSVLQELPRIRANLKHLRAPLLIAYSTQDHSVPPANSLSLPNLVGGEATLLPLEQSYHLAPLDYDRELLEQRIAEFADHVSGVHSEP